MLTSFEQWEKAWRKAFKMTTYDDKLKEREDAVLNAVKDWPHSWELIAYKYLHNQGCLISNIDYEIRAAIKKEDAPSS